MAGTIGTTTSWTMPPAVNNPGSMVPFIGGGNPNASGMTTGGQPFSAGGGTAFTGNGPTPSASPYDIFPTEWSGWNIAARDTGLKSDLDARNAFLQWLQQMNTLNETQDFQQKQTIQQRGWNVDDTNEANRFGDFEKTKGGALDLLNQIIGRGYSDPKQIATAKGEYGGVLKELAGQRAPLENIEANGIFSDADNAKFNASYGGANSLLSGLAQTGGIDPGTLAGLESGFRGNEARLGTTADRGALTGDEYNQDLAASLQEVQDAGRSAAENTFGGNNISGSPFAGAALLQKTATNAGKNRAATKAGLDKYQADTRLGAAGALTQALGTHGGFENNLGGNKVQAAGDLGQLLSTLSSRQLQSGQGKLDAAKILAQLTGQGTDIAGKLAGLDTSGMPDFLKSIFEQAKGGWNSPFSPGLTQPKNNGKYKIYVDKKGRSHAIVNQ